MSTEETAPSMAEADPMPLAEGVSIGGAAPTADTPTLTLDEFVSSLGRARKAGFRAYASAHNMTRATLADWRAALDAHANRPIR
jgi:hypothetical protein